MKKINSILMILAAAAGFTNCAKTELVEPKETGNGGTVVYATTDAVTKTTLADDYKVLWSTGDQIKFVKSGTPATTYTFTLSSGSGTTSGTFTCNETPADGTYTVYYPETYNDTNWPAQTYVNATDISGAPMTATATVSGGSVSDISFKNEGGILRYTVKGTKTIKSINVTSSSPALNVTLNCGDGVALTADGTVFNIALPAGEYSNATLRFIATDNTVATKTASSFIVTKNKISLATFESLTYLPDGALAGKFSVAEGKKVHFSKGNLVATVNASGAPTAWKFATNQYDYIGEGGANKTIGMSEGDIDLFGWSTKNTTYGISTSTSSSSYSGDFVDWGKNIGDGNTWRTLSNDEWKYLFITRTASTVNGTENARYAKAKVNDIKGVILLPDTYTHPEGVTPLTNINTSGAAFTVNTYVLTDWAKMESAGAVFLPAAGNRSGFAVENVGDIGRCWSSTAYNNKQAHLVYFNSSMVNPGNYGNRNIGLSVRLITDVE